MRCVNSILAAATLLSSLVEAQLSGAVGPTTTIAAKRAKKQCNVLDAAYGGKADGQTDVGPAITKAFNACKTGGVVVIPAGNYALNTWVNLSGGAGWALQLDGVLNRVGTAGGNMIFVQRTSDFEFFSSTGKGAVQGNGYVFHKDGNLSGPRILRLYKVDRFAVHDLALVDSPAFHFVLDTNTNGEVYNMAIRGANSGGLDGINIFSNNIHVHDVMVTNKDECVTTKSPSKNILVENIYCNWSGGSAFGSLGADVAISNVVYRNVYTTNSNQMMMIKSNGGSGTVDNCAFENFIGHSNAYSLNVEQYWSSMSPVAGNGVKLNNFRFTNWTGTAANGKSRGPIQFKCADGAPCTNMIADNINIWTETGNTINWICRSAYGDGACLKAGTGGSYAATTKAINAAPTGYQAPKMKEDLTTHFGTVATIPIPTHPASYFPNIAPLKAQPTA
ncbi:Rhamnogalacturonase B-like protein [Elsinoe fawcettii]|nr:Rhamnogalacturonase B-like protein [Elsinoe fawcettii]